MICSTIYGIEIPPNILSCIKFPKYPRNISGVAHTEIDDWSELSLMRGRHIITHNDGINSYRPLLILDNPHNNYIIRGKEQILQPQKRGTLVVLDISQDHEVHSIDPIADHKPWVTLVGKLCAKIDSTPQNVGEFAKKTFIEYLKEIN